MTTSSQAVRDLGEVLICQATGALDIGLPTGWISDAVLVVTPPADFWGERHLLAELVSALQPWDLRPLPWPTAAPASLELLAAAIAAAASDGARVLCLTDGRPWEDAVAMAIVRRRAGGFASLDGEGRGDAPFGLQVVEPASGVARKVAETPLDRLEAIMRLLLGEPGCPWDREQTHATLRPYILEEAAEVIEAIERGSPAMLVDELGDVLLQVAFHAALAGKAGDFVLRDVARAIEGKMLHRHPHVFSDWQVAGAGEVLANWEVLKANEAGSPQPVGSVDRWRPLRKAAVQVSLVALEAAFAAARGDQASVARASAELTQAVASLTELAGRV